MASMNPEDDLTSPDGDAPTLPPVEPPSAGFIVQLFLVPAVIVAAVVGVYLLFGHMASGELDWRQQLQDVSSENPHVRWRAALGLAQMLDADARLGDSGQQLAANPEIAEALTRLFDETRSAPLRDEETDRQIEFLAKSLGQLDRGDLVFPNLLDTAQTDRDPEIRKHALTAVVMIAGRAFEREAPLDDPEMISTMIEIAENGDLLARHQAVFILGLVDSTEATKTLELLLSASDLMTRVNAAIGLARNNSTAGLPVFEDVLRDAAARPLDPASTATSEDMESYGERALIVTNCIKALNKLDPHMTSFERSRLAEALREVAAASGDDKVRIDAQDLSLRLSSASGN